MRIAFFGDSLTEGIPGVSVLEKLGPMLPEHEVKNFGKRGDTVISLYRRISRGQHRDPLDVAVLWIGVNDTLAKVSFSHSVLKRLMRQPRAKDLTEFRDYYQRTVELLLREDADRVLAVSPLLIGEDLSSVWNRELDDLGGIIASVAASFAAVDYIDLRARVVQRLVANALSDSIPHHVTRIACDTLFLRTPRAVDSASSRRGLQLTLDGIHLNSTGATAVAEEFRQALRALC